MLDGIKHKNEYNKQQKPQGKRLKMFMITSYRLKTFT